MAGSEKTGLESSKDYLLENAYYAMYGSNEHANAFRNKILTIFTTTETTMENYYYLQTR